MIATIVAIPFITIPNISKPANIVTSVISKSMSHLLLGIKIPPTF